MDIVAIGTLIVVLACIPLAFQMHRRQQAALKALEAAGPPPEALALARAGDINAARTALLKVYPHMRPAHAKRAVETWAREAA